MGPVYPDMGICLIVVHEKRYATFRENISVIKVQSKHRKLYLWHDYFVDKIKALNPLVEFVYIS